MGNQNLEKAVEKFEAAIKEARENPHILYLDDYENWIAGNIRAGNFSEARRHIVLLVGFYIGENPYSPGADDELIEIMKESAKPLYEIMDAGRKMYKVGKAAEELLALIE